MKKAFIHSGTFCSTDYCVVFGEYRPNHCRGCRAEGNSRLNKWKIAEFHWKHSWKKWKIWRKHRLTPMRM